MNREKGNWNVFKNGEMTGPYSAGDYDAEEAPSWYERNFQFTSKQNTNVSLGQPSPVTIGKEIEKENGN